MPDRSLVVIVAHHVTGTLFQRANGNLEFSYEPGYNGIPLSHSVAAVLGAQGARRVVGRFPAVPFGELDVIQQIMP